MESYDIRTDRWVAMPSMPKEREEFGVGVVDNKIYVMGGSDNNGDYLVTYDVFDIKNNTWKTFKLPWYSSQFGTAIVGDNIITIGGRRGQHYLSNVNVLNTQTNSVTNLPQMPTKRDSFAVTVIDNRYIWALGGFGGKEYLNSIEIYDLIENKWYECYTVMTKTRSFPKTVSVGHKIYCVSGNVDHTQMDILDTDTMIWKSGSELPVHRTYHDVIVF